MAWTVNRWPPPPAKELRDGYTSTSDSASRRWFRITSPTASTVQLQSEKRACSHGAFSMRGEDAT